MTMQEAVLIARWFIAEGGTLEEFVDVLERPDRWRPEINAALALSEIDTEGMVQ